MNWLRIHDRISPIVRGNGRTARHVTKLQDIRSGMSWREEDIGSMLRSGEISGYAATRHGRGAPILFIGAILFRTMADEGEILSLAVRRSERRRGIASALMSSALRAMKLGGAEKIFLEVSEANRAARALYQRFGFEKVGVRYNYYSTKHQKSHNALVFRLEFSPPGARRHRVGFTRQSRDPYRRSRHWKARKTLILRKH